MAKKAVDCSQCGEVSLKFREGVCIECFEDNQFALDSHNEQYDWWESLTDEERESYIKNAY